MSIFSKILLATVVGVASANNNTNSSGNNPTTTTTPTPTTVTLATGYVEYRSTLTCAALTTGNHTTTQHVEQFADGGFLATQLNCQSQAVANTTAQACKAVAVHGIHTAWATAANQHTITFKTWASAADATTVFCTTSAKENLAAGFKASAAANAVASTGACTLAVTDATGTAQTCPSTPAAAASNAHTVGAMLSVVVGGFMALLL